LAENTVYSCARCSSYLLCSTVTMRSTEASAGTWEADAPSHWPRGVHQTLCQFHRFTPGLAARLVDACLHELPRLLRPYALKLSSSPVGAWPAAQPRAAPAPRWATAAVRTARARAALHGLPLVRLAHWLLGGKGQQIHPRTMLQQIHRQL
jgi:hypothetical protein